MPAQIQSYFLTEQTPPLAKPVHEKGKKGIFFKIEIKIVFGIDPFAGLCN